METRRRRGGTVPPPPPPPPPRPPPPPMPRRGTANDEAGATTENLSTVLATAAARRDHRPEEGGRGDYEADESRWHPRDDNDNEGSRRNNAQSAATSPRGSEQRDDPFVMVGGVEQGETSTSVAPPRGLAAAPARDDIDLPSQRNVEPLDVPSSWIVNIRAADSSGATSSSPSLLLRVQVNSRTTPQALSEGIRHALQLDPVSAPIPGLFDEDTGIYYFLDDVLSRSSSRTQPVSFCLYPPRHQPRRHEAKHRRLPDSIVQMLEWCQSRPGAAAVALLMAVIGISLAGSIILHPLDVLRRQALLRSRDLLTNAGNGLRFALRETHQRMIVLPLRDLYRNGPWIFGGWEGDRLERVCSRITFHGDNEFWIRNAAECERIYAAKEEAWLRVARPLVHLIVLGIVGAVIMRFLRRPIPRRLSATERDALETYRAIQMLMRLLKKNS